MVKFIAALFLIIGLPMLFGSAIVAKDGDVGTQPNPNIRGFLLFQPWDHFDETNKICRNEEFSANIDNPPVFIFVNGDWDSIEPNTILDRGLIYDLAQNISGFMVSVDYRFNRESMVAPLIQTAMYMNFITTEQGLEDIAELVRYIKRMPVYSNSKVIVYGSSFGGSIAAWSRQMYPDIIDGAWAVAAPLAAKLDFDNFYAELGNVIRDIDETCFDIFKVGLDQAEEKVNGGEAAEVTRILNLCQDISRDDGSYFTFFYKLSEFVSTFVTNASRYLLELTCNGINVPNLTELERLGLFMAGTQGGSCFDIDYAQFINHLKNESYFNSDRVALYQQCTELGWFKSMNNQSDIFGNRVTASEISSLCSVVLGFDDEYIRNSIDTFNSRYGGQYPNVTNVYFTHGELNPWRYLSVQYALNEKTEAVVIPDYGRLWELFSLSPGRVDGLNEARQIAVDLITSWITD